MEDRKHSEEGVIGLLVQHPQEYLPISTKLTPEHFVDPANRDYFEWFEKLTNDDKTWDEILFLDQFPEISTDRFNKILESGNYLHLNQYIENVRLKHIARKLFKESTKAQDISVDKVRELVEDFYQVDNWMR